MMCIVVGVGLKAISQKRMHHTEDRKAWPLGLGQSGQDREGPRRPGALSGGSRGAMEDSKSNSF